MVDEIVIKLKNIIKDYETYLISSEEVLKRVRKLVELEKKIIDKK